MSGPRPVADCPECAGRWLNGWRWQHTASCPLLDHLDASQANDATRIRSTFVTFQRAPNHAEAVLWTTVTGKPLTAWTTVIPLTANIPATCVAGVPDAAEVSTII